MAYPIESSLLQAIEVQDHHERDASGKQISYYSALSLLRGKVYDALENHGRAVKWYQAALKADPFCYEAFQVSLSGSERAACSIIGAPLFSIS